MKKEEYLEKMAQQMRCEKAKQMVKSEMEDHIKDQTEAFMLTGIPEHEAEEKAVEEMGDPVEAGVMMDRAHRPQMAWGMLILIAVISAAGILVQFLIHTGNGSETTDMQTMINDSFFRQILYSAAGFVVMSVVYFADYSILGRWPKICAGLFLLFMFLNVFFTGIQMNGAVMYTGIGSFMISLPMLMYLYIPLYGAVLYRERGNGWPALFRGVVWMIIPVFFAIRIPSVGTALNLFAAMLVMLTIAVVKGWFCVRKGVAAAGLWGSVLSVPAVLALLVINDGGGVLAKYQVMRIRAWLAPELYAETAGFRNVKFREIMNTSRLFGVNKEGIRGYQELWKGDSNYVLAHITTYYGLLVSAVIIGLLVWLVLKAFRIASEQKNQLGMMVGYGCGLVLGFQILFYVLLNFGLIPAASGFLPFFSDGMTGTIVTYILLGLLLSIYRFQNILPAETKRGKKLEIS